MPVPVDAPPQVILREERRTTTTESWGVWSNGKEIEEWLTAAGGVYDQNYASQ